MSKWIEVGTLVQIVDSPKFVRGRKLIGRFGRVIGESSYYKNQELRPIYDNQTFDSFMRDVMKPVV